MVLLKKYWQFLILTNTAAVQMLFQPHFCFDCRTCTVVFHPSASRFESVRQQWLGRVSLDALHQKLRRHLLYLIQQKVQACGYIGQRNLIQSQKLFTNKKVTHISWAVEIAQLVGMSHGSLLCFHSFNRIISVLKLSF